MPRLSERSARGYHRIGSLAGGMLKKLSFIAAQTKDDAQRFAELGFPKARMKVTGTLKYDIAVSDTLRHKGKQLREQWLKGRSEHARIFIAASTHKGEDEQVIEAFQTIRSSLSDTLLILVPRHPERFEPVYELIRSTGLQVSRRSS